jgi:hypothetical protein
MAPIYILHHLISYSFSSGTGGKWNEPDESTGKWKLSSSTKGSEVLRDLIDLYEIGSRYRSPRDPKQVE